MRDLGEIRFPCISRGEDGAAFTVKSPHGPEMMVVASYGGGWEHVSVSTKHRTPNWHEMELVKRAFFKPDEVVMQLHVPAERHINNHPHCLHMWRPIDREIPLPPGWMVGIEGLELTP